MQTVISSEKSVDSKRLVDPLRPTPVEQLSAHGMALELTRRSRQKLT